MEITGRSIFAGICTDLYMHEILPIVWGCDIMNVV